MDEASVIPDRTPGPEDPCQVLITFDPKTFNVNAQWTANCKTFEFILGVMRMGEIAVDNTMRAAAVTNALSKPMPANSGDLVALLQAQKKPF
jgi:hypothetical protein